MFPVIIANPESIWVIALVVLAFLIFGHKLPQLARGLGSSVAEFKKGVKEGEEEANKEETPEKKEEKK